MHPPQDLFLIAVVLPMPQHAVSIDPEFLGNRHPALPQSQTVFQSLEA
jgi:hypothetical protein